MTRTDTPLRLEEARRLDAEGQQGRALHALTLLLRLDPGCVEAKVERAGLLSTMGRHAEAEALCLEALASGTFLQPARLNLAGALMGQARYAEADAQYRLLLEADPGLTLAHLGLGTSLGCQGRLQEARACLDRTVALEPGNRQGWEALLRVLMQLKDWPAVFTAWNLIAQRFLAPFKGAVEEAMIHLTFGHFDPGWDLMERRLLEPGWIIPARNFPQPRWDGAPFPGKTLLLHWEQGYGDTLMFIRYATLAKARGGRVLALVQKPLVKVVATVPGLDGVLGHGDPLPPFDLQVSIFSLPQVFGTRLETVPGAVPYLQAPALADPVLGAALAEPRLGLRAGLVWAGSTAHRSDGQRSAPLDALACLEDLPGLTWHSLQVGYEGGLPFPGIRDLAPHLTDFGATAWVIQQLDLVVTVDTAVAHLAGALGKPVWLLIPFIPEWRWLLEREDSPWYPTLRIFRQEQPNQWEPVLARVRSALLDRLRGTC
jgi:hypothetical protein